MATDSKRKFAAPHPFSLSKRARTGESTATVVVARDGRKLFLGHLRATCERYSSKVDLEALSGKPVGQVEGLDILRLFLRDVLAHPGDKSSTKKFPLVECECRHNAKSGLGVPAGIEPCYTGGSKDAGKAQAFVMEDFRITLLKWLRQRQVNSVDELSEVEQDYETDDDDANPEELAGTQSSFSPSDYPSSDFLAQSRDKKRVTTKQRLTVLHYLLNHSDDLLTFRQAFKALCTSGASLLHLCGCGISTQDLSMSCVTGSHLKLDSHELNKDHTHVHFTLRLASSREKYLKMLEALQGSRGGALDDVF